MTSKQHISTLLADYNGWFPAEQERTLLFSQFLSATPEGLLTDRKNKNGHITASAFIINKEGTHVLLLRHKSLGRWLQPGGHTEITDASLPAAALREAVEETGIAAADLHLTAVGNAPDMPFDIDSHYIPANAAKQEAGHYHHDIRYLFRYTGMGTHSFNEAEATGQQWVTLAALAADDTFTGIAQKIINAIPRATITPSRTK